MAVKVDSSHHIARYCGYQKIDWSTNPPSVTPFAFELRAHAQPPETYLSVNHCEHHSGTRLEQLRSILGDLTAKNFTWRKSGAFAVLRSGRIVECGQARDRSLRVRRRQHPQDVSYASIDGLPPDNGDLQLLELLAVEATGEVQLVNDIPEP